MSDKSKSNFGGLKNSELIFMSFIMKDVFETYEEIIDQKGVSNRLTLPDGSFLESFKSLDDESLEELTTSKRYSYIISIHEKLNNVSTLVQESFPEIYEEIEEMFSNSEDGKNNIL